MISADRAADELLVVAVERPAVLVLVAEQAAVELGPADVGETLAVLAGVCAAALEEVAQLRGLDAGKVLDEVLRGEQVSVEVAPES